jgi:hypothetical protein
MILKKHNGTTALGIRPQTVNSLWCFLESRNSFRNPTCLPNKVQASTWDNKKVLANNSGIKGKRERQQGTLHRNISQMDSTIQIRKESHSSRCTILAIRPDTLSSSTDIYFIKPQDLLALSKASFAWHFIKDKRPSRSEILSEYSVHRQEGRGGKEAPESNISAGDEARSRPNDPPTCAG